MDKSEAVQGEQLEMLSATCIELEGTVARQAHQLASQQAEIEQLQAQVESLERGKLAAENEGARGAQWVEEGEAPQSPPQVELPPPIE
jgi:cell division protein FtsB